MTLRQLFTDFGRDPRWQRFAQASTQAITSVYLRTMGDSDITKMQRADIDSQCAASGAATEYKVKARSCMMHMLEWAIEQGIKVTTLREATITPKPLPIVIKPKAPAPEPPKKAKPKPKPKVKAKPKPKPKVKAARPKRGQIQMVVPKTDTTTFDREAWLADTRPRTGTVEREHASNGWRGDHRRMKDCYRATIMIQGTRYRFRSGSRTECEEWLKAVLAKKIMPTDNKADWWRMEQHKDEAVRIDELIVSQAEESVMLYDYHQTKDLTAISDYLVKRLLPHMAYYCAHTLHFGKDRTLTASRQAAALLLTRIVSGRPVMSFTSTCKRMLRVHANRGDFFYYENAPQEVKLICNRIDLSPLASLWKVTKDRRI